MSTKQTIVHKPIPASLKKIIEEKKAWAKKVRTGNIKTPSTENSRRIA